ncbi:uncharacterized protein LOC121080809 isoform X1 [Falco naumanni]|uniref:uncharacterized protein LOC121080809 isoform X1 n=2 Tax=Falco naumanni TaxID=148594 RepID=UPI001ADE2A07|nr:uncharacterized protein LOC121080809 isoform X1 [Falco naumanni]XP_040434913.1 uncharacterized protein LOC121080809 isoform X1 [Falco naumanni]
MFTEASIALSLLLLHRWRARCFQRRRQRSLSGQPVPVFCHPQSKDILPHIQRVTPVMGSCLSSACLPNLPQPANVSVQTEQACPLCHNAEDGIAYAIPCNHQFCLGCIVRWRQNSPFCPLCRGPMETIRFSVWAENDFLLYTLIETDELPDASSQAGGAPDLTESRPYIPLVAPPFSPQQMLSPAEQGAVGTEAVGGLLPSVWASLFQRQEHLLDPVLPWLREVLAAICGDQWWLARSAESSILHCLCACGLNRELMVQWLQDSLQEYAAQVVDGIVNVIVERCSEEAQRLLQSHTVGE